jgi:hypothetical protein
VEESKTKDTTKKNKKDKINTKNICVGQVFKNYTEFCKAIKVTPKTSGNSKKLQIKRIQETINFKIEGRSKIIVTEIKENDKRGYNATTYCKLINNALIILLHKNSKKGYYYTTKTDLLVNLGLINKNFSKCRANTSVVAYHLDIPKLVLINFFKTNMDRVNATLKYNVEKFINKINEENEYCCELDKGFVRLCFNTGREDKIRYRLATQEEIELINKCEEEVLKELKIDSREELQYRDKWNTFITESLLKVKQLEGFKDLKFYYKLYRFEVDEEKFEQLYCELEEKDLNKIVNKINKQSKKASKESIVARQKKASGRLLKNNYEKDYEKVRDELLVKEDVIKQNNICINSFIKATAKEIDINEVIKKNRRKHKKEAKQEVVTEEVIEVIETIEEYEEISWKYDMATESNIPF